MIMLQTPQFLEFEGFVFLCFVILRRCVGVVLLCGLVGGRGLFPWVWCGAFVAERVGIVPYGWVRGGGGGTVLNRSLLGMFYCGDWFGTIPYGGWFGVFSGFRV